MTHWLKYGPLFLLLGMPVLTGLSACNANIDFDGDGYASDIDCNDEDASIHPEAVEVCDNIDQDCDGEVDEELAQTTHYPDADGDGYGDATSPVAACVAPPGTVSNGSDCDDGNTSIHPEAVEVCDNIDQDCDGEVDEELAQTTHYPDADGDGYGDDASPVAACVAPPGTVSNGSDCDDDNTSIHPEAVEICDNIDQDCDGEVDEDVVRIYYVDADGDGYGNGEAASPVEACVAPPGTVSNGSDCDDDNASSYPAAPDTAGDGIDQSCDGTDGLAPSVGLPGSSFTSIQAALDAASDGQTVWVGPGTYNEYGLNMQGKALRLASTAGQETTILDGMGLGTVFYFDSAETETSSVEGFTVTGGEASCNTRTGATSCSYAGGGMYLDESSPTLSNVTFTGNEAYKYGGGMYLSDSSPTLSNVTFTGNEASGYGYDGDGYGYGGGMYLYKSSPTLSNVTFTGNSASGEDYGKDAPHGYGYGGGMYLYNSSPTLDNVTFTGNTASGYGYGYPYGFGYGYGGGMYLDSSSPTLDNVTFTGNTARGDGDAVGNGSGGGMYLDNSDPTLSNVTFTGNEAEYGGGMYLSSSSPTLSNVTFTGNTAYKYGGGMYLSSSSPTLKNVTFTGNEAEYGGGMYLYYSSSPTLSNVILAYNRASSGGNFYNYSSSSVKATRSLFYNPSGWGRDNLTPTGTYLTVEPQFLDYADSSSGASCTPGTSTSCLPSDLHPALGSPLIDAGDPAMSDVDGSRADIGSYGGPLGDRWDVDGDGYFDYFWPGEWDDAPSGFDPADYDCDDLDPDVQGC